MIDTPRKKPIPQARRISSAERALQIHVVHDPSVAVTADEAIDPNRLHDHTLRILGLATEFTAACQLVGIMDMAISLHEPLEFLEYLDGLDGLPDWFISELPTLDAALRELAPPQVIPECGALAEWQKEIRMGHRRLLNFDALWIAAVYEAQARDFLRDGMIGAANEARRSAAAVILATAAAA